MAIELHRVKGFAQPPTIGYVVAIYERGEWNLTWDGLLHDTLRAALHQMTQAADAGWDARVCRVVSDTLRRAP